MDIRKWVLQNAFLHGGKASLGAVIGKLIAEDVSVKDRLGELRPEVERIILEVNESSFDEIKSDLEEEYPELLNQPKKEKHIKELPNVVDGAVVLRFPPSPSGPLHIGHCLVLGLSSFYAKRYSGKLVLRLEDTNPENLYPPAYELIVKDAQWLTENGVADVRIQSDHLSEYYDVCESLLHDGKAYVCTCDADIFRTLVNHGRPCPCRENASKENVKLFALMFSEFKAGEAVVRFKTDLSLNNPALRDWPMMRVNDHEHPRTGTKHRVWPLMNFSVAVDDHVTGVTHSIRGKDHADNEKKQTFLQKAMGWESPTCVYIGRMNFVGLELSTTKTRLAIERGEFTGWDDPRLAFLPALKRRGYQAATLRKFAESMGVSLADKVVSQEDLFKTLNAFNREVVDDSAPRVFVIPDPVRLSVENAPHKIAKISVHPDHPERGFRTLDARESFYLSRKDKESFEGGKLYRLMGCYNFIVEDVALVFHSEENSVARGEGAKLLHWIPVQESVPCRIVMPDNTILEGVAEKSLLDRQVGDIVQCERFGFCRVDALQPLTLYYGHQ